MIMFDTSSPIHIDSDNFNSNLPGFEDLPEMQAKFWFARLQRRDEKKGG